MKAPPRHAPLIAVVTVAMTSGTMLAVALGALGPFIVDDLNLSPSQLGVLVTINFVTASMASMVAGRIVDRVDERKALLGLFLYSSAILLAASAASSYPWLLVVFALGGPPLASANPITNRLLSLHVDTDRHGMAMGIKQSGVPIGILLSGIALPVLAGLVGWQGSLGMMALLPLLAAAVAWVYVPAGLIEKSPPQAGSWKPRGLIFWLMVFAFFMGGGVASTHTFLPLYGHEVLGLSEQLAGLTLSAIGVTGIVARILWTHLAGKAGRVRAALFMVSGASAVSSAAFLAAPVFGVALVWFGAAVQGASAVAWAPIAMLAVLRGVGTPETGHASAMVNLGFFAGFIVSPPAFGKLVEWTGAYTVGWLTVAGQFLAAVAVLALWRARGRTVGGGPSGA